MRTKGITGSVALTAAIVGLVGAPSVAAPFEKGHFHDSGSEVIRDCDLTLRHAFDVKGSFLGVKKGKNGLLHFSERLRGTESFTNLATGKSYTHTFRGINKDLKVTDNGDGTLTIVVLLTGNDKWASSDGQLRLHDPGQTRLRLLVDHGGTPLDPSDDVEIGDAVVIKGSTGRNDLEGRDFCDDLHQATD